MKAFLLHPDRDADFEAPLPPNAESLGQDLELDTLLDAMANGDEYLRWVAERTILNGLREPEAILYRQRILADCLRNPDLLRELYAVAVEGVETRRRARLFWSRNSPDGVLHSGLSMLELLADVLERLRLLAADHAGEFRSDGFGRLFAMLERELADDYLASVRAHLQELRFKRGALISAELGRANRGNRYTLRKPRERGLLERLTPAWTAGYSFTIPTRDDAGLRALAELRDKGINRVASALGQSTDHVLGFFAMLRAELGFYVGCLNLFEHLAEKEEPTCFPEPVGTEAGAFRARGLYDASLAFHLGARVVGNDVHGDGKLLVMITGANQGGKSTLLRSVGLAQLMLQAGMFVPAEAFRASVCRGIFTHFKREEDAAMESGKLDEELGRMSEIADLAEPGSLLLCNESFSSTNEREGSEIARQLIRAMVDSRVRVLFVTHLFDLAHGFHGEHLETALFLRAERLAGGERTHRILEGEPEPTSYGKDSHRRVFGETEDAAAVTADRQ